MKKIAVILFPGTNCENETALAIESVGMEAEIVRWNNVNHLHNYDGYVLPGGWSYEDRIRAGVISAQDPLMNIIKKEAKKGKPVLGICNGCQVLAETGLVPGLKDEIEVALAPNKNPRVSGFYCTWVHLKVSSAKKGAFNLSFNEDDVFKIPIAHGEGRFTSADKELINKLKSNDQILFKYCDEDGNISDEFPINPNGSISSIAGITNKQGNVLAMMPHPERGNWAKQVPGEHPKGENAALARKIFESMRKYLENE